MCNVIGKVNGGQYDYDVANGAPVEKHHWKEQYVQNGLTFWHSVEETGADTRNMVWECHQWRVLYRVSKVWRRILVKMGELWAAMKSGLAMFMLLIMVSVATRAQQAGSLKDTLLWMHNFAAENGSQFTGQSTIDNHTCKVGSPNCGQRHDVSTFESQGCSATIIWSAMLNDKEIGTHVYLVSLKDLNPNSVSWVKVGSFENAVEVDTTNTKPVIETFSLPMERSQEHMKQSSVDVLFDSADHAKRFATTFKHAIELCGGKP